jgi:creatinine amidohydrolase
MRLQLCTSDEVGEYLSRSTGIIIPIGSAEQHGPMGLIGTDAICPEVIAWQAGEELDALVAPTINVGMAQHHLGFPGTITLRPSTLMAVIADHVASLVQHGFERIYFLNGHGGNVATASAAFSELYAESSMGLSDVGGRVRCKFANWYLYREVAVLSRELFGEAEGSHGTPSEVSVTQYAYPDDIKSMDPIPASRERYPDHFTDAADYRRRYADGRMRSDSYLASPEAGERFVKAAVSALKTDYQRFLGVS